MTPLGPNYERERLWVLRQHAILDTAAEERFDQIVDQAAERFAMPIALFSLIDEERQWFKAKVGLDIPEADRRDSFCSHVVAINSPLVVENASMDSSFSDNPFVVGYPGIAFYAGVPIRANSGYPLGTLCLIDREPRSFPWQEFSSLQELGRLVEFRLEERLAEAGGM